jgi:hypothetical protein
MTIEQHSDILRWAGVQSVDFYEKKLRDNQNDAPRLEDLACESRVALIFQAHGWSVTMRESPDLEGWIDGLYMGIEVKHCRWKPDHDPVVQATLKSSRGEFVKIPRLIETEKHEEESANAFSLVCGRRYHTLDRCRHQRLHIVARAARLIAK